MFGWLKKHAVAAQRLRLDAASAPLAQEAPAHGNAWSLDLMRTAQATTDFAGLIRQAALPVEPGELAEASRYFEALIERDGTSAALRLVLGIVLSRQNRHPQAKSQLNRAVLLAPQQAAAYYFLGQLARAAGDHDSAIGHFGEAIAAAPLVEAPYLDLAASLLACARTDEARQILLQGAARCPDAASLHFELGTLYGGADDFEQASNSYQMALEINPRFHEAYCNLGVVLQHQGETAQAIANFESALAIHPDYLAARSSLLWVLSFYLDGSINDVYLRHARAYGETVLALAGQAPVASTSSAARAPSAVRRVRVGLVSGDLRNHPVGWFTEGVLRHLNRATIELVAYSMNPRDDALTERVRGLFVQWTPVASLDDAALAERIRGDRIDILIDLAGHSGNNRLPVFARRPAPVQVSWLGYLASTGVPGIDYFLADPVSVPSSGRGAFTETVWYLPETIFCFTPPTQASSLAIGTLPALQNHYITFGSHQRLNKLSDATISAWARIFRRMPDAKLSLRNAGMNSQAARHKLLQRLTRAGIDPERVTIDGVIHARDEYLASYGRIDLILDTFPHPGVTTTCEALWMGVPTVTLGGHSMLGRMGASLLTCAGLTNWIAWNEDEYVDLAVSHASDVAGVARLREGLRARVLGTRLFDAKKFAPDLESALLVMWERHTQCSVG